jgi:hypothetical protein
MLKQLVLTEIPDVEFHRPKRMNESELLTVKQTIDESILKSSEDAFFKENEMNTIYHVRVNYRELGFLARNNPRGVTRRKHPEGRRPEGCFLRATLPRDVSR